MSYRAYLCIVYKAKPDVFVFAFTYQLAQVFLRSYVRLHLTSPVFLLTRAFRERINKQPARHMTAAILAELTGHKDVAKYLVDLGCSVNTPPTLWAARWDNEVSGVRCPEVAAILKSITTAWRNYALRL